MTKKLKTMLLPTGEFALIATGFHKSHQDALEEFRQQIGATGALQAIEDDEIHVEDALADGAARRADSEPQDDEEEPEQLPETDETHIFFPAGKFVNIGQLNPKDGQSFSVEFTAQQSPEFARVLFGSTVTEGDEQLDAGATFSPAGLAVDGEKTTAGLEPDPSPQPSLWEAGSPKLAAGTLVRVVEVAGGNREPYLEYIGLEGPVVGSGLDYFTTVGTKLGSIACAVVEAVQAPAPPKPGDQVRVNGLSWGGERYHGSVGTFLRVRDDWDGKNCVVQFDGIPGTRTFDLDQLEPLIEPKLDFPIDYSQDSRLVDIVSRLRYAEARMRGNMGWLTWGDQKDGIKRIWRSDTERQLRELSS